MRKALIRVINILGSQAILARKCGVTQQQVSKWLRKGIPIKRVLAVEKAVNGLVTRYELRPDFYPREEN